MMFQPVCPLSLNAKYFVLDFIDHIESGLETHLFKIYIHILSANILWNLNSPPEVKSVCSGSDSENQRLDCQGISKII